MAMRWMRARARFEHRLVGLEIFAGVSAALKEVAICDVFFLVDR